MQSISLCDNLSFASAPAMAYTFRPGGMDAASASWRKRELLKKTPGVQGAVIHVEKRIRWCGLGATAAMRWRHCGLRSLVGLKWTRVYFTVWRPAWLDVPFFLSGRPWPRGGGDHQATSGGLPDLAGGHVPPLPGAGKTGKLYGALTPITIRTRLHNAIIETLKSGAAIIDPDLLFNTFENVVFRPVGNWPYRTHIRKIG